MKVDRLSLDDPAALAAADPRDMLGAVASLGTQLRVGFERGIRAAGTTTEADGVVVCGMGGSGIAGDVVSALYWDRLAVPLCVVRGHVLPGFCSPRTLVVIVSYSGNTNEMLWTYRQATARQCRVVTIGSGGDLANRALADGVPHVSIPAEAPAPRAAVGYMSGAAMGVLESAGLIASRERSVEATAGLLDRLADEWGPRVAADGNDAKSVASWLLGRIPVVWGSEGWAEVAARRWKTQLNENAKLPAFSAAFPELAHNEIEGYSPGTGDRFAVLVLRHEREHPDVAAQVASTLDVVGAVVETREVWARGEDEVQSLFSSIMLADFATAYLGILRGVDPTDIPAIKGLKARLSR